MKIKRITFICLLSIFACKSQEDYSNQIIECFEAKYDDRFDYGHYTSKNLFESFKEFETILLDRRVLNGTTKQDYLKVIDNAINTNLYNDYYLTIPDDLGVKEYFTSSVQTSYKMCVYELLGKNRESKYLDNYLFLFDNLEASGFTDLKVLRNIISNTDFNNEKTRLLACGWLYCSIFEKR